MRIPRLLAIVSVFWAAMLNAGSAQALETRTWVSGGGDDANTCRRSAPCKTFAGAHSKTEAGGTINCLDSGGFGGLTITKSITIDCTNAFAAVRSPGTTAIAVNGAGANVVLRGLDIDGAATGRIGINFTQGASLQVAKCNIHGFQNGSAQGIRFAPSTTAQMFVSDTTISHNGAAAAGGGIFIDPGAGSASVTLQRVQLNKNFEGFRASGADGGTVFANIQDSLASMNVTNGFVAESAQEPLVTLDIQRSSSNLNGGNGILAVGPAASVTIGTSMVTGNKFGFNRVKRGVIRSYGNNAVDNNAVDDAVDGNAASGVPLTTAPTL